MYVMAFDVLILVVAVGACVTGFVKGILGQVGQVAGVIAGVALARIFGVAISGWFATAEAAPSAFEYACGYSIAFIVGYLGVWLIVRVIRAAVRALHLGIVDRMGGAVFTLLLWGLLLSGAVNLYALATNDVELLEGDSQRPWRTAVIKLAPVTLGYIGHEALNNVSGKDVLNYIGSKSENNKDE